MGMTWKQYVTEIASQLTGLSARNGRGEELAVEDAFAQWEQLTAELRAQRRIIYLVGNGASASMASHMAADLAKNGRLHTQVFTEASLVTAISNDIAYEDVFALPLSMRAEAGDMLVAISSSGGSPNVLKAARAAADKGMTIVTLSAMKEGNPLRAAGTLNFYVPCSTYGHAESTHAAVLHFWMDRVEKQAAGE